MMETANNAFKVYQASAGAGKTYTIVKEFLSLCLKSNDAPSKYNQILAITFTNMAANEMKEKVLDHLIDIINSLPDEAPGDMEKALIETLHIDRNLLKKRAKDLFTEIIHDYSNLHICTIDAFVQTLARSFAKELKLPSQFNVSIDEEEVAEAITERLGEQIGPKDTFLTSIVEDYSGRKFENEKSPRIDGNIHNFIRVLFSEDAYQKDEKNLFDTPNEYNEARNFILKKTALFEAQCQQFAKRFDAFMTQHRLTSEDFSGKSKSACLNFFNKIQQKKYVLVGESLKQIVNDGVDWYHKSRATAMRALDAEFQEVFVNFVTDYQKQIGNYLFLKSQLNNLSLYFLRAKIKLELNAYIGEEQIVHISEFNKRINEVMDDFSVPFVYERIGEHFKHLFIDEFQDTSVLQWQNLIPLLDNSLSNNNLCMVVGDGKQSIYRWRNGEVKQILHLPYIWGKPSGTPAFSTFERNMVNQFSFDELKTNHRSLDNIIDFNNDFFEFSFDFLSDELKKVYVNDDKQTGKKVTIEQLKYIHEPGYVQVELFDPAECDNEMMLGRVKELIDDILEKGFCKSDITVLVRTNKIGSMVAKYLTEHKIEVVSAESILLKTSDKVQLIVSALDFMIHSDNPTVAATMLYYWNATHREGFDGTADGIFEPARQIAKGTVSMEETLGLEPLALKKLLSRSYSLYDLCSAMMRLFGFNTVGDPFLNYLLDTVFKWQSSNEASIKGFLDYWDNKKNKLAVASSNTDAVNIMTIHKSKGLEFNVVIYPFVNDNLDEKKPSTLWTTAEALGFDPIPNIEKVQFTLTSESAKWSEQAQRFANEENDMIRLDNLNLNYVAFTRAKQRLHILSYKAKDLKKSPLNAFMVHHPSPYGDPNTRKVVLKKKKSDNTVDFMNESAAGEWFSKIKIDQKPSMFWMHPDDPMSPKEWGTLVHQILSEVQHSDDFERAVKPHRDAGEIDAATAAMLEDRFRQMATHPLISEAFNPKAKVKNECEILMDDGKIKRPDRYAELDDKIYLLDYKTGKPDKEHHDQLRTYMNIVKKMVKKPLVAYLVYLEETVRVVPVDKDEHQLSFGF